MAAPTLVSSVNTGALSAATSKTMSVTVQVGDLVLVRAGSSGSTQVLGPPTGGTGMTWSTATSATGVTNNPNVYTWAGTATTAETFTITIPSTNTTFFWGAAAQVWRNHGGVGAVTATTNAGSTASRAITTTAANSAISMLVDDYNAIDGTTRAYNTATAGTFTESYYQRNASWITLYAGAYLDAGAAGAKTVGITTPTGMVSGMAVVEIKPAAAPTPTLISRWTGAVTASSATVAVKTANATTARLKVATDAGLTTGVVFGAAQTPDSNGNTKLTVTGLTAGTQYFYGVEVNAVVNTTKTGKFKTFPSGASSFAFAFGSCTNGADSVAFSAISARNPDLFVHVGDLNYLDATSNTPSLFQGMYDGVLGSTNQAALLANVPTAYVWSDHDFGTDNCDATAASAPAAQLTYRQYVPSYPLGAADGKGIYQTFVYGRIRFILTDNRSYKSALASTDNSSKTMLGATQKQWFKDTITAATEPIIVWAMENPWVDAVTAGADDWGGYSTERTELANFITASGKKVIIIAGDAHAVAADDGTHSAGGIPVLQGAPFAHTAFMEGGPYTAGPYPSANGATTLNQYGWVQVTDTGGSTVTFAFTGYDAGGTARVTQTTTFTLGRAVDRWSGSALVRQQSDKWSGSALVPQRSDA